VVSALAVLQEKQINQPRQEKLHYVRSVSEAYRGSNAQALGSCKKVRQETSDLVRATKITRSIRSAEMPAFFVLGIGWIPSFEKEHQRLRSFLNKCLKSC
jgi:hypothetical protein